jgi:hypothetical protein
MARLAQLVDEHIDADFVDINCGGWGWCRKGGISLL